MLTKDPYYDIKAVSNSSLGYIDPDNGGSPQKFKDFLDGKLKEDKASHFINGTLIHLAMLEPEKFEVAKVVKPSSVLGDVAEAMVIQDLEVNDKNIVNTIRAFNWHNNWGDATILKKFDEQGGRKYVEYMSELKGSGKIGMDQNTGKTVDACVTSLKTNRIANFLLQEKYKNGEIDAYNELEVRWSQTIKDIKLDFKAKLDRLIIDHNEKNFIIVDVKTTGKEIGKFRNSFEAYNYDRQVRFYRKAALEYLEMHDMGDYTFDRAFIVCVETSNYHASEVFDVTSYADAKETKDKLLNLVRRVAFHYRENNWMQSMESIKNDGVVKLVPSWTSKVI